MIIDELVENITKSRFEIFDDEIVEQAKKRIIDIVGCIVGGANAPGCSMIRDLVEEWDGKKEASILVHGIKVPAHNAAWLNGIMARSYDYGVLIPYIGDTWVPAHTSETTVPTAINAAEWKHAGGKELITALILGDDITARLCAASKYSPGISWDGPGIVNRFGATAIAGKLLGLDERHLLNAFGIILNQMAGSFQGLNEGTHSFKLSQGLAARDGIVAAELAGKGWTGSKDPLLGKYGYFSLYCQDYNTDILTKDLGKEFYGDKIFKPYPCCRWIHSSIDGALNLTHEHDIKAEDIDEVNVNLPEGRRGDPVTQPFYLGNFPQAKALNSISYQLANVLLRKSVKLEHLTEEYIRDAKVLALTKMVNITFTLQSDKPFATEVKVRMKDGKEFATRLDVAKGDPFKSPLTGEEIEEKFWRNIAFSKTVSNQNGEAALSMLNRLEEIDDITRLVELLIV